MTAALFVIPPLTTSHYQCDIILSASPLFKRVFYHFLFVLWYSRYYLCECLSTEKNMSLVCDGHLFSFWFSKIDSIAVMWQKWHFNAAKPNRSVGQKAETSCSCIKKVIKYESFFVVFYMYLHPRQKKNNSIAYRRCFTASLLIDAKWSINISTGRNTLLTCFYFA